MTDMRVTLLFTLALAALIGSGDPRPAMAQSASFRPAITVNDAIITEYELQQRQKFLEILRVPVDIRAEAEKGLIEDRLRSQAAKQAGITLSPDQLNAGMAEFASRANLEVEPFLQAIGQGGVAPETYRDFVTSGLLWREVVRARFNQRITVTESEIDRAMSVTANRGAGPKVLLSEIIMPTTPGTAIEMRDTALELVPTLRSEAAFAAAARQYSAAPSRDRGGDIGWIPLTNLPPQARQIVAGLANGQVSDPVPLGNAIGIFRLRGIRQSQDISQSDISVDYAQLLIPGGAGAAAEAERIRGEVDTCDDLYRVARKLPADRLTRETRALTQVPADIAAELAHLDENEISSALSRGDARVVLMLCTRRATLSASAITVPVTATDAADGAAPAIDPSLGFAQGPNRDRVRDELTDQKLAKMAEAYLAELKAMAVITRR
ncbi:MAG: peptidylprolyl isomerase [Rhodobacteraceae bacterium]|nr:peptidylprolyl isomerase [Paracoccaceae bacterium]